LRFNYAKFVNAEVLMVVNESVTDFAPCDCVDAISSCKNTSGYTNSSSSIVSVSIHHLLSLWILCCFPIFVCFSVWRTNKESEMQRFYFIFIYVFNKLSVAEMKMLSLMCGKTSWDKIRNDNI